MKRLYFSLIAIITFVGFAALALADPGTTWDQQINGHGRFKVLNEFGGAAVLDKETGRVWEQSPSTVVFPWTGSATVLDAHSHCYQLEVGGRKGWRLPTIEELASLVDTSQVSPTATTPALPAGHPFNVLPTPHWSSTTNAFDAARAKSLFLAASDLADPVERAAYLDRECGGDDELRARVDELLLAHEAMGSIHGGRPAAPAGTPVGGQARWSAPINRRPASVIDPESEG